MVVSLSLSLTQFLGLGFISFFNGVFNLRQISNYSSSSCWVFREAQFGFCFLQSVFLWKQNDSVLPEAKSEERGVESSERESRWDRFGDDEFGVERRVRRASACVDYEDGSAWSGDSSSGMKELELMVLFLFCVFW